MYRYTLSPTWIAGQRTGWELAGTVPHTLHATFAPEDFDRDVDAAIEWAENLIDLGPLRWFHHRDQHGDRWEANA